jgi:hypothetical protein
VVSEGVAPSAYLLPHPGLPTWWDDDEDDRFEVVMPKGTIISVVADANGDTRVVPANGTSSAFTWGDGQTPNDETGATPASASGTNVDTVAVAAKSVPVGCLQFNALRPFDKGTSPAASWITMGYVEWPLVNGVNADLAIGDCVRSDHMGRPVKMTLGTNEHWLQVGKVIEVEKFAVNYDDGLLSYMQLPSDPGALKEVYSMVHAGPYQGKLGIRGNLDVYNSVGAVRVSLTL